ncbi:NAS35-like protein [Mya arenaria]|uniref:NAS35-like protein n=1 Tax=Mya arenaria TaxID=6604 RepID=A0ABY7F681_MYAAR|nr:NAS35-like protein [Mya arenaria]
MTEPFTTREKARPGNLGQSVSYEDDDGAGATESNTARTSTAPKEQAWIRKGVEHWEEQTCIHFTNTATVSAKSLLFVLFQCRKGIVAHEIGHALGFWHEQARNDRDEYITVINDNVELDQVIKDFQIRKHIECTSNEKLHLFQQFGQLTARDESQLTIRTNKPLLQHTIGQREELSFFDVKLANLAYCNGYQDPKNCSRCRCPDGLGGDFCDTVATSANCGGIIELQTDETKRVASPAYPSYYRPGVKCYWLIKSPKGTVIKLRFVAPYMQSDTCSQSNPFTPCDDFLEVRTSDNLGLTGGRFCCNDTSQTKLMQFPVVSDANHILLLFKTVYGVTRGFQVDISSDALSCGGLAPVQLYRHLYNHLSFQNLAARSEVIQRPNLEESCGGCEDTVTEKQYRCKRQVKRPCEQTWSTVEVDPSCINPYTGCTREKTVFHSRTSECLKSESYCCDGFTKELNQPFCTKDAVSRIDPIISSSITTEEARTTGPQGWNTWSDWSSCSVSCGGCGQQSRNRTCLEGQTCSGANTETQPCGTTPCDTGNTQQTCSSTKTVSISCMFVGTCYKLVTEYYSQPSKCCCGFEVANSLCVVKQRR